MYLNVSNYYYLNYLRVALNSFWIYFDKVFDLFLRVATAFHILTYLSFFLSFAYLP
jgi:hypothetical protein